MTKVGKSILGTLCLRINSQCNLACGFCRAGSSPSIRGQIDVEQFKRFALEANARLGLQHISISGGEPGLDKRLPDLVEFLLTSGLHVSITTNGTTRLSSRLRPTILGAVSKIRIRVSIDGDARLHDALRGKSTFATAIQEIQRFKEIGAWVGINTVVLPETILCGDALIAVANELNVDQWALITPVPEGSAAGEAWFADEVVPRVSEFRAAIRASGYMDRVTVWNFAGTPNTSVLVVTNGDIVLAGVRGYDNCILGSIYKYDVDAIANAIYIIESKYPKCHFSWSGWR